MTEEYIDIVDHTGKPTGKTALKSKIHSQGFFHNTAHIWFYTKDGYILLQQRAASKSIYPLLWDVSVSGHIDAGESITEGGIRETQEEIGLKIVTTDLQKIGVFDCFQTYDNGIIDNEFHHTFIAELKVPLLELTPQEEEVEALKLVTIDTFKDLLKHSATNGHFVASNYTYYEMVINHIVKHLN